MRALILTTLLTLWALCLPFSASAAAYKGEIKPKITPPAHALLVYRGLTSGPYFGILAGYDSFKISRYLNSATSLFSTTDNATINATGLVGGLTLGYGKYFRKTYYLATEVSYNVSAAEQKDSTSTTGSGNTITSSTQLNAYSSYGIGLRPGITLNNNALLYFKLAYNIVKLQTQRGVFTNNSPTSVVNATNWCNGVGYGLGVEAAMREHFTFRGEFVHTDYSSYHVSNTKFSPSDNQFVVGLMYHIT